MMLFGYSLVSPACGLLRIVSQFKKDENQSEEDELFHRLKLIFYFVHGVQSVSILLDCLVNENSKYLSQTEG